MHILLCPQKLDSNTLLHLLLGTIRVIMNEFGNSSPERKEVSTAQLVLLVVFFGGVAVWSSPVEILRSLERQTAVVIGSGLNLAQPPKKEAPTCTPERDKQETNKCAVRGENESVKFQKYIKYILQKTVVSATQCTYTCVLEEQNICKSEQTTLFISGVLSSPAKCSVCGNNKSTVSCKNSSGASVKLSNEQKNEVYNKIQETLGKDSSNTSTVGGGKIVGLDDALNNNPTKKLGLVGNNLFDSNGKLISSLEEVGLIESRLENGEILYEMPSGKLISRTELETTIGSYRIDASTGKLGLISQTSTTQPPQVVTPRIPTVSPSPQVPSLPSAGNLNPTTQEGLRGPLAAQNTTQPTFQNRYQSFQRPQAFQQQQKPRSFIQRFAGGNSVVQRLSNFVTGGQADLRTSPEGLQGGGVQPQVIYVTPDFATPRGLNNENFRSIQAIASDISAQTQPTLARVDRFAQTLTAVGGPNAINTENKSFGRIQDLIVEDEAIRSLRVAEEKGNRAKNQVFCKANEASADCNERREVKAKEVERESFVEELEKRVLPESAIQHFLAVYDGWVRPSPAPATYATSTLALLNSQGSIPEQPYKIVTNGSAFVSWIVDSVSDATTKAVTTLTNLITGGTTAN